MKRYGPSHRRTQNASAALRIFVRHHKKAFATKSARSRHGPLATGVSFQKDCVAKLFCSGRAKFLTTAEALSVSGRGGLRQLSLIHSAALLFLLRRRL